MPSCWSNVVVIYSGCVYSFVIDLSRSSLSLTTMEQHR